MFERFSPAARAAVVEAQEQADSWTTVKLPPTTSCSASLAAAPIPPSAS